MEAALVLVFLACCAVSALSLAENEMRPKPSATLSPASEFNTAAPNTTTATKTTTTTTKPPPPPPEPTPATNLTVGNYTLMSGDKICLMAQMALQILLVTPEGPEFPDGSEETFIVQPELTTTEGGCQDTTANLTLTFEEGFITFMFSKDATYNLVSVENLTLSLSYPLSTQGNGQYSASNQSVYLYCAEVGHSYSCRYDIEYLGKGLWLEIYQAQIQAFNLTRSNEFGPRDHCILDGPDVTPAILSGLALLVLSIVALVTCLLGLRKTASGYRSL